MRYLIWFVVLSIVFASCSKKNSHVGCIIPRETFLDMLIDTHVADGLYASQYGHYKHHTDTSNFFIDLCKKYGYSKECFDSTFKFYLNKPEMFDSIYDDVVTELTLMQQSSFRLQTFNNDSAINLYKGQKTWKLPLQGRNNKVPFDITLKDKDTLTYTFLIYMRFLPHDGCQNPRLTAYFWHNDGTRNGLREYFPTLQYTKSQRYKLYTLDCKRSDTLATHIKGFLLNTDNDDDFRHVDIQRIIVYSH